MKRGAGLNVGMEEDLYVVLGLEGGGPGVPQARIRKAYRARALLCHPDKRGDDPVAAAEFVRLQKAYEVLGDEKARIVYDELLLVRRERSNNEKQQSEKRQKMMRDLCERERAHELEQQAKAAEEQVARRLKAEIARIQKAHAQKQGKHLHQDNNLPKTEVFTQTAGLEASDLAKTIKVSWSCLEGGGGGYSAARLKEIFGQFGSVEDVVIRQGKSLKKSSALLVMGSKQAAIAATETLCGDMSNPLLVVPVISAEGAPPLKTGQQGAAAPAQPYQGVKPVIGAGYRAYEDVTLLKMRQAAERARLVKEMQEEDARGVRVADL